MKIVVAYLKINRAAEVIQTLHRSGVRGFTAYVVHGASADKQPVLHGVRPFDPANLPESAKIEIVCEDHLVDRIVETIVQTAKTGYTGDGIVTVMNVEKMLPIRDTP